MPRRDPPGTSGRGDLRVVPHACRARTYAGRMHVEVKDVSSDTPTGDIPGGFRPVQRGKRPKRPKRPKHVRDWLKETDWVFDSDPDAEAKTIAWCEEKLIGASAALRVARRRGRGGPGRPRFRRPKGEPIDADDDGLVFDSTPRERPARPGERLADQVGRAGRGGGTGRRWNGRPRGRPMPADTPAERLRRTGPGTYADDKPAPRAAAPTLTPAPERARAAVPTVIQPPDIPKPRSFFTPAESFAPGSVPRPPRSGEKNSRTAPMTDAEWEARRAYALSVLDAPEWRMGGPNDTNVKYRDAETGRWTPERMKFHQEILDAVFKEADERGVGKNRRAILAGGPPGAGKSSVLGMLKDSGEIPDGGTKNPDGPGRIDDKWLTLNPDEFKEMILHRGGATIPEGLTPAEASSLVHEESSYLADLAGYRARQGGYDTIYDITMNGGGFVKKTLDPLHGNTPDLNDDLIDGGASPEPIEPYNSVKAVFVDADPEVSVLNTIKRAREGMDEYEVEGKGLGGRIVPIEVARGITNGSGKFRTATRANLQREAERGSFDQVDVYTLNDVNKETGQFKGFNKSSVWPDPEIAGLSDEELYDRMGTIAAELQQAADAAEDDRDDSVQEPLAQLSLLRMERRSRLNRAQRDADLLGPPDENATSEERAARNSQVGELLGAANIAKEGTPDGAGTPEDPIDVQGDLDRAVELLAEGKSVRLNQPDEVATLVKKLADLGQQAHERGEQAPTIDLCKVSVKGTNLFCHDTKGIPRIEMPQLSGVVPDESGAARYRRDVEDPESRANLREVFAEALLSAGIGSSEKTIAASHLRATQGELDGVQIGGMVDAIRAGKIDDKRIYTTRDGYIIDGHHGWAAKVTLDAEDGTIGDTMMDVIELDMDIGHALDFAKAFASKMGVPQKGIGTENRPLVDRRTAEVAESG